MQDTTGGEDQNKPPEGVLNVKRRDVMKAAGAAGVITGGFSGVSSAQGCDVACQAGSGPDNCRCAVPESCRFISKTEINGDECVTVSVPEGTTLAAVKAGTDCILYGDDEGENLNPGGTSEICISEDCQGISHIEFYGCPSAEVTVDCPNDRATISVKNTDSVYYEVHYEDCDESSASGTLTGSGTTWSDTVPLADCEGTITVWNDDTKEKQLDTADFDCESGTVTADCEADTITVYAEDTTDLWYEIDFDNCDVDDVDRTKVNGLDTEDTVTILEPVPNCEGTVTLYEDEGSTDALDSDTFNCVTASVSVACTLDEHGDAEATIEAPDAETVWYEIDYDNCDEDDVLDPRGSVDLSGSTDSVTFAIAECDGTIRVYDAESDGTLLDSATIDCADATVSVACNVDETGEAEATIFAPDTDPVWYEIDYDNCDEDDVSRTQLDLSGSTDEATFGIAECDGTITVYDAASNGTEIASTDFTCADATVSVDCALDELGDATATITAPDADTVWYTTTYTNCDESGVTRERVDLSGTDSEGNEIDSATVDLAECDGTIDVYDAASDGTLLASADIDCADATVDVTCSVDELGDATATITAPDADTVWYTTTYENCDSGTGVTREPVDLSGTDSEGNEIDSATVDLAECDGTIDVYDAQSNGDLIASADIDCADATVDVTCSVDELGDATATINAPDADTVWYEIDYDNCDVDDVGRTALDLSSDDEVTFDIAECDGTIDVYDAETGGDLIATAEIDCADAQVTVDCEFNELGDATATIEAPDTDQVWYEVDYSDNCDESDVPRTKVELLGSTDTADVDLAECSGTIRVWDAAEGGTKIAESTFNCGDADVTVDCATDTFGDATATITAPDLDTVWYSTSYVHCDESGVTREPVDLSGDTDSATVDLAECDGTIEVYDAASEGNLIADAIIDCADAQVSVDCVDEEATITAPDTDVVEYEISYADDCTTGDVTKTQVTLGDDDEATVAVADCAGTINVYDLEGDLLATADFDCAPEVTGLDADCEQVTVDFTDFIAGDEVRIDVDVKDSTGTTVTSLDSGTVTMESGGGGTNVTVNDTDSDDVFEQVVYTYSNEVDPGTSWQTVDVSVFLVDQDRFLDADPTTDGFQQTRTFDVGPCGCPDCPDDLEVKFEEPGVSVCDEADGFVITDVTRDAEGELRSVCFATMPERPVYCELGVCVKAGRETEKEVVEPDTATFDETQCGFDVNGDDTVTSDATISEYCVEAFDKHAISHITIICPDDDCPEENRGGGNGKGKGKGN